MNKIFFTILILSTQMTFGLDCRRVSKDEGFENSDIVFFGRVIDVNDSSYRIRVLEAFKGNIADTLVGIITKDNEAPRKGSHWLIYGVSDDYKSFGVPPCSGSKSQDRPFGWSDISFPLPPPKILDNNRPLTEIFTQIQANKSLNEFYFEIESLREKVRKSELKLLRDALYELKVDNASVNGKIAKLQLLILVLLAVSTISGVLLLIKLSERNKLNR